MILLHFSQVQHLFVHNQKKRRIAYPLYYFLFFDNFYRCTPHVTTLSYQHCDSNKMEKMIIFPKVTHFISTACFSSVGLPTLLSMVTKYPQLQRLTLAYYTLNLQQMNALLVLAKQATVFLYNCRFEEQSYSTISMYDLLEAQFANRVFEIVQPHSNDNEEMLRELELKKQLMISPTHYHNFDKIEALKPEYSLKVHYTFLEQCRKFPYLYFSDRFRIFRSLNTDEEKNVSLKEFVTRHSSTRTSIK